MSKSEPVVLKGDLTAEEVPEIYRRSLAWKDSDPPGRIDLSKVERVDSSAIALLLEWLSWARARGGSIEFDSPPDNLRVIAGLSEVEGLLGWEKSDG